MAVRRDVLRFVVLALSVHLVDPPYSPCSCLLYGRLFKPSDGAARLHRAHQMHPMHLWAWRTPRRTAAHQARGLRLVDCFLELLGLGPNLLLHDLLCALGRLID